MPAAAPRPAGWQGRLWLQMALRHGRTCALRRRHSGPVYIQRPLYPEADGAAHVMLLHPPGGVVQGDDLRFEIECGAGAGVLLTTPSAAKIYRAPRQLSRQSVVLRAGAGAQLEWLPQETIIFDGARAEAEVSLDLAAGARVIAWDVWTLGRAAAGESFASGLYDSRWRVSVDDRPLWHERTRLPGTEHSVMQTAPWGLAGHQAMGTFIAYRPEGFDDADVDALRRLLEAQPPVSGVSVVDGLLVVRVIGAEASVLVSTLRALWARLRPVVCGKAAVPPRIWAT